MGGTSSTPICSGHPALRPSTGLHFSELPEDIFISILSFLPVREIGRIAVTCKLMNRVLSDMYLWKILVARDLSLAVPEDAMDAKKYRPELDGDLNEV